MLAGMAPPSPNKTVASKKSKVTSAENLAHMPDASPSGPGALHAPLRTAPATPLTDGRVKRVGEMRETCAEQNASRVASHVAVPVNDWPQCSESAGHLVKIRSDMPSG